MKYWRNMFEGSSMTILRICLESIGNASLKSPDSKHLVSRNVYIQPHQEHGHAASTSYLVQSVWSMVLSALSGRTDIMFRYLLHGRDEDVADSDQTIGCCVTGRPFRVQINDTMPITELASAVQKQVHSSAPHAHLGSNTIANKCTDWPSCGRLDHHSSFVLHQSVPAKDHWPVGDAGYLHVEKSDPEFQMVYDVDLLTTSRASGELSLESRCLKEAFSIDEVNAVARAFVVAFGSIVHGVGTLGNVLEKLLRVPALPVVVSGNTVGS